MEAIDSRARLEPSFRMPKSAQKCNESTDQGVDNPTHQGELLNSEQSHG